MKTIIFFREGLGGHYLKSLIDDSTNPMKFRVDPWYPGLYYHKKFVVEDCVCLHKHLVDWQKLSASFDLVLTIQVQKKIYHAIYNNFYKKFLIENPHLQQDFKNWSQNCTFWYDVTYYNLKEYYGLYQQDLAENTFQNIIDFDNILQVDYIEHIIKKYLGKDLTHNMRRIVSEYAALQLRYDLSGSETDMQDIIRVIPDTEFEESPWFASYCIFKYETSNNLSESQREWSIDSVSTPIDKKFLLEISAKYRL